MTPPLTFTPHCGCRITHAGGVWEWQYCRWHGGRNDVRAEVEGLQAEVKRLREMNRRLVALMASRIIEVGGE